MRAKSAVCDFHLTLCVVLPCPYRSLASFGINNFPHPKHSIEIRTYFADPHAKCGGTELAPDREFGSVPHVDEIFIMPGRFECNRLDICWRNLCSE
jgi:hypothetical protein